MELYFLRHAIAAEPDGSKYRSDAERPLTDEGIEKMVKAARGFKKAGCVFRRIVSSPYVRARQTAEIAAKAAGFEGEIFFSETLTPDADFKALTHLLASLGNQEHTLFVGHQPSISRFVSELIAGRPDVSVDFGKGALCRVELLQKVPPSGILKAFFSSSDLQQMVE